MNKKMTAILAGSAGAALLLGGGTFALWSDRATVPAGTIVAGDLDVEISAAEWWDVSADRVDSPHEIDAETFKKIPGDTIEARYPITLDLVGENMMATLAFEIDGQNALTGTLAPGLTNLTYTVLDEDDAVVGTENAASLNVLLASADNGNADSPTVTLVEGQNYTVVVSVTFDEETTGTNLVNTQATLLNNSTLALKQVRAGFGYTS